MSFKSEFSEVFNYLSDVCKDPTIITFEASEDDFRWKDNDPSTGVIIQYNGEAKIVKIPNGVVEIGSRDEDIDGKYDPYGTYGCFQGCFLTDVILPNSLKKIGDSAFFECLNLTSIDVIDSVESIGDWAFSGCNSLAAIFISDSVKSIGRAAFSHCNSLTSIDIPNSVESIGDGAFYECDNLTSITCSADLDLSPASVPDGCSVIHR